MPIVSGNVPAQYTTQSFRHWLHVSVAGQPAPLVGFAVSLQMFRMHFVFASSGPKIQPSLQFGSLPSLFLKSLSETVFTAEHFALRSVSFAIVPGSGQLACENAVTINASANGRCFTATLTRDGDKITVDVSNPKTKIEINKK